MTCKEIIKKYLVDNGFDGIVSEDCGCGINDLGSCFNGFDLCAPAYKFIAKFEFCKTCKLDEIECAFRKEEEDGEPELFYSENKDFPCRVNKDVKK
jgi:hypothetical protein